MSLLQLKNGENGLIEETVDEDTTAYNNEGIVNLEYKGLKPDREYVIRYLISDKEIITSETKEDSMNQGGCKLPYITQ